MFTVSTVPAFIRVQYFFIDLLASVMVPARSPHYTIPSCHRQVLNLSNDSDNTHLFCLDD